MRNFLSLKHICLEMLLVVSRKLGQDDAPFSARGYFYVVPDELTRSLDDFSEHCIAPFVDLLLSDRVSLRRNPMEAPANPYEGFIESYDGVTIRIVHVYRLDTNQSGFQVDMDYVPVEVDA